jgi:hypothetical protein
MEPIDDPKGGLSSADSNSRPENTRENGARNGRARIQSST